MTRRLTITLPDELHKALKLYSAYEDITLTQAAIKALREFTTNNSELINQLQNNSK
jgi:hypothetical protein